MVGIGVIREAELCRFLVTSAIKQPTFQTHVKKCKTGKDSPEEGRSDRVHHNIARPRVCVAESEEGNSMQHKPPRGDSDSCQVGTS